MLPNPLHPAVVHFPVVLAFLLPVFALGTLWIIHRGAPPLRAWSVPVALALVLAASAWLAVETGEPQAERVEDVVAEQPLETHEEMAETFYAGAAILALVAAAGLVGGLAGKVARVATVVGSLALVVGAALVGHSGGQLVYRYGAASAYAPGPPTNGAPRERTAIRRTGDDDDR